MKKSPKKLVLCRETLRRLNIDQVKLAVGGTSLTCPPPPLTSNSVNICCADE